MSIQIEPSALSYSYLDFQYRVIQDIINKDKILDIPEDNDVVNKLDEKVVDTILSKKYMNVNNLDILKNMFKMVMLYNIDHVKKTDGMNIPFLDNSIVNLLANMRLASKNTRESYAILSNFKSVKDMLIIKTSKEVTDPLEYLNPLHEYFVSAYGINNLRKFIPNFAYTLGIFRCNPLEVLKDELGTVDSKKFCTGDDKNYYYLIQERIKGAPLSSFINEIEKSSDVHKLVSYLVQIALALTVAQKKIGFVHYDLHTDNIILRDLDEPIVIEYTIDDKVYKIETDKIPTIIDYGFSHFIYKGMPFGKKEAESNLGISSTKTPLGFDLFKVLLWSVDQLVFRNKIKEAKILIEYFKEKEDPYGIYFSFTDYMKTYSLQKEQELKRRLQNAKKTYFSITEKHAVLYNLSPLQFVKYVQNINVPHLKLKIYPSEFNYVSDILKKYNAKIENKRLFHYNENDNLKNYDSLDRKYESLILNSYVIYEYKRIIDNFGNNLEDRSIIEKKIKELDSFNQQNMKILIDNDKKIIDMMTNELFAIIDKIDLDINELDRKISNKIEPIFSLKDDEKVQMSHPELNMYSKVSLFKQKDEYVSKYFDEFISSYKNYKYFIQYSKSSLTKKELDPTIKNFYYQLKKNKHSYDLVKTEILFSYLKVNMMYVYKTIYKSIDVKSWNLDTNFYKAVPRVEETLNYISEFYPWLRTYCDYFSSILFRMIYLISYTGKILYVSPKSKFQLSQVYLCNKKKLEELLGKHIRNKTKVNMAMDIIGQMLNSKLNDFDIYNELKHKNLLYKEEDKTKRASSRLYQINFMFNLDSFIDLRKNIGNNFSYLDLGGGSGSITSEIGKYLNLPKEKIINADIKEWFNNVLPKDLESDITYVTINNHGRLPFNDNQFSLITAFQSLHHIEDAEFRIKELSRIMRKGGFLLIREHDLDDTCTKMLIDIDHSLYEVSENKDFNKYLNEYKGFYQSRQTWNMLLSKYFKLLPNLDYRNKTERNPTRIYYELYVKR